MDQAALLAAARGGDADAFGRLAGGYRDELLAYCYRMLGSVSEAEDVLPGSLVRAWRELAQSTLPVRLSLFRIVTDRCLALIEQQPRRELPTGRPSGATAAGVAWLEPYPDRPGPADDRRESLSLAFVAALQQLTGPDRAVLLLHDVAGFPAAEVAGLLGPSVADVGRVLQRARAATAGCRVPSGDPADPAVQALTRRYAAAWEAADADAIVALLTGEATYAMPPLPEWYRGPAAIRAFLAAGPMHQRWRMLPARANGQPAFGTYLWDDGRYRWAGLDVLQVGERGITEVVSFLTDGLDQPFRLPGTVD